MVHTPGDHVDKLILEARFRERYAHNMGANTHTGQLTKAMIVKEVHSWKALRNALGMLIYCCSVAFRYTPLGGLNNGLLTAVPWNPRPL
jgi:hypothetical protein